jgi:precorrin-6A/cobalt-precorrin-6A reductase
VILVLAGTRDGRELAAELARQGFPVTVAVVSGYGRELAADESLTVNTGALDAAGLADLITKQGVRAVIDASHPYAAGASVNAQTACAVRGVPYLRYERPTAPLPVYGKLHRAADPAAAAKLAAGLGQVIFLTTGSRSLAVFKQEPTLAGHRLIARVLPEPEVIAACRQLGFAPRDIVALQGQIYRGGIPVKQGIVVLGHGSRASVGEANQVVFEISGMIKARVGHEMVETAIMNRKSELPTIEDAVKKLVARGADSIVIVPMFFADGMHIRHDIPEEIAELTAALPGVAITMAGHIGADPRIADILLERVREVE